MLQHPGDALALKALDPQVLQLVADHARKIEANPQEQMAEQAVRKAKALEGIRKQRVMESELGRDDRGRGPIVLFADKRTSLHRANSLQQYAELSLASIGQWQINCICLLSNSVERCVGNGMLVKSSQSHSPPLPSRKPLKYLSTSVVERCAKDCFPSIFRTNIAIIKAGIATGARTTARQPVTCPCL